ncbi:gluzincin family metallopeptidase [Helicobacter salomonis]|uniref:hypothetical protein n=1 Tax=Helicobacter salomonis TaxID=56878 RepID=UPI000CF0F39F|nr:hypothetical protein [Helicobacter salomonis]
MAQLFDGACNGWNWTNNTGKGADLLITLRGCEGREFGSVTASSTNVGGIATYTYTPTPPQIGASVRIWLNTLRFDMIVPGGRVEDGSTTGSAGQWMLSRVNNPGWWNNPYYNAQGRYIDRNYGGYANVDNLRHDQEYTFVRSPIYTTRQAPTRSFVLSVRPGETLSIQRLANPDRHHGPFSLCVHTCEGNHFLPFEP